MKEEINLTELWSVIKQNMSKLLLSMLLGTCFMAVMVFFIIAPKYSSQTQLIAQLPQQNQIVGNDVNNNLMMINTYKDLVKSNLVIDDATKELNKKYHYQLTAKQVNSMVSVSQQQNSQMFTIQSTSTTPKQAKDIANVVAQVFKRKASKVMKVDKISITSKAIENKKPVSPNKILFLLFGAVIGLILGLLWILIINMKDKTVKSEEWITSTLGIPILGMIPKINPADLSRSSK